MNEHKDYPGIRAWGAMLGSDLAYIDIQVKRARRANAPQDATYEMDNGAWATISDIKDLENRPDMQRFVRIRDHLREQSDNASV